VRALATRVREHLGAPDWQRFAATLGLFEGDRLRLGTLLAELYPGKAAADAQALLRGFREAVRRAFAEAGLKLSLAADSRKRTPPGERWCWFEGEGLAERLERERTTSEVEITDAALTVAQRGLIVGRKPIARLAVVCTRRDEKQAKGLVEQLETSLAASLAFDAQCWAPWKVLAGEEPAKKREAHLSAAHLVLVMESPALAADRELKLTIERRMLEGRRLLPVSLGLVDGARHDLGCLAGLQAFPRSGKPWSQLKPIEREGFVQALFAEIEDLLQARAEGRPDVSTALAELAGLETCGLDRLVRGRGVPTSLRHLSAVAEAAPDAAENAVDALEFLERWATEAGQPRLCAVLGESGIGKTTVCRLLTQRLLARREADVTSPQPIYLDLRRYTWSGEVSFTLPSIIELVLAKSWRAGHGSPLSAGDVIDLVANGGAVAIFDGLDEVIVHMPPKLGQDFIRQLWSILPLRQAKDAANGGRLLISCRSHYFRTASEQSSMLLGEEREDVRSSAYTGLTLLPFDGAQVEEYLQKNVPGLDLDRALALIRSTHNLPELAGRPYTLSLIAEQLEELERRRATGRTVRGVDLYAAMVERWLRRDDGKHVFNATHKQLLMEHLAAALWRSGARQWRHADIEEWLDAFLYENPVLAAAYANKDREVLKEDLRTATFIVRPDDESFRFAHTSLQEYFLACYLHRALREGRPERLALTLPSLETLDFLLQLLASREDHRQACEATARTALGRYQPQVSELVFRLWLLAQVRGERLPRPETLDLCGARLADWRIEGTRGRPLDLRRANFSGASLLRVLFAHAELADADLSGADARWSEWHEVRVTRSRFVAGDLLASLWRLCTITDCDLADAPLAKAQFVRCGMEAVRWPAAAPPFLANCSEDGRRRSSLAHDRRAVLDLLTGHSASVAACAWSPDGRLLASASHDGTVRLWDAAGDALRVLDGHRGPVAACAWSPDGRLLASASDDGTVRLWDAAGDARGVLDGHRGGVTACAWSPDGGILASSGRDDTLRLWDASGGSLCLLQGHRGWVTDCSWSPDGRVLASTSRDGTLRLWGAAGEPLRVLQGHRSWVTACAWTLDGQVLTSIGRDGTVRLWDATGEALRVLKGHPGEATACAWNPGGRFLAIGGASGIVRLWDDLGGGVYCLDGHRGGISACTWSSDGRILASAGERTVRLWNAAGEPLSVLQGHQAHVTACAWCPDGRVLASAGNDGTVRLWDAAGEVLRVLEGHRPGVTACAWSAGGDLLASAGNDGMLRLWGAAGEPLRVLEGHQDSVTACAWSPNGRILASAGGDGTVRLWNAAGEAVRVLKGHRGGATACAWSPDGRILASAGHDGTVRLWDATGETLRIIKGHQGCVTACAWSPDRRLVSASDDGTVRIWDAGGEALRVLEGHRREVTACVGARTAAPSPPLAMMVRCACGMPAASPYASSGGTVIR